MTFDDDPRSLYEACLKAAAGGLIPEAERVWVRSPMADPAIEAAARRLARYDIEAISFGADPNQVEEFIEREWKSYYGKALACVGAYKNALKKIDA